MPGDPSASRTFCTPMSSEHARKRRNPDQEGKISAARKKRLPLLFDGARHLRFHLNDRLGSRTCCRGAISEHLSRLRSVARPPTPASLRWRRGRTRRSLSDPGRLAGYEAVPVPAGGGRFYNNHQWVIFERLLIRAKPSVFRYNGAIIWSLMSVKSRRNQP